MTNIVNFVSSIGVNTHVDATTTPYGDVALIESSLGYLGISFIRDHGYGSDLAAYTQLVNAGVGLDLILDDDPQAEINSLISLAPAIRTFEGPNEVDVQPFSTNNDSDHSPDAATGEQQLIRNDILATNAVSSVPLLAESLADPGNYARYAGNLAYSDFLNLHSYAIQGDGPRTVLSADLGVARSLANLPAAVTETGYYTMPTDASGDGVDEMVQAKLTLDTLFDSAALGISLTFLYELFDDAPDPNSTNPELHYGLFNSDGTPKLAATALHNLTSILAAANTTPGIAPALSLSTSGLPDTGQTYVLTGDAGTTVIAVWAEPKIWDGATQSEVAAPVVTTTINFGTVVGSALVLDPLTGTSILATYSNVSSITVGVTDHPLLIAVSVPAPVSTPPATTTPITTVPTGSTSTGTTTTGSTTTGTTATGTAPGNTTPLDKTIGVYRFFDKSNGTYFYTASASEAQSVSQTRPDLVPEGTNGIGLLAISPASNDPNAAPVYRFFDTKFGTHFFTASASERDTIIATRTDLSYEPNSVFYEHTTFQSGDVPVYRFFDNLHGTHFYTDSETERATIINTRTDLVAEGVGFYEPPANPA